MTRGTFWRLRTSSVVEDLAPTGRVTLRRKAVPMGSWSRIVLVVAAAMVGVLVLNGCGSGSAGSGAGGRSAGGSAGSPADPVAADTRSPAGAASFEGTVTDASGRPVSGIMLMASSLASPPLPVPELAVVTDAHGHYTWHGLPPGPYAVSASRAAASAKMQVTVVGGRTMTADLVLR